MNYYTEKMLECGADGIDFISFDTTFLSGDYFNCKVICSYTKEQFETVNCIPKTPYLFWKMVDGKKVYY